MPFTVSHVVAVLPFTSRRLRRWFDPTGLVVGATVAWSIVLGAYTHVMWDTFTHEGRLGSHWLPVLNATVGPLPLYKWLQYGSGIFGLAVLAWWLLRWWRRTPADPSAGGVTDPMLRRLSWLAVGGSIVLVAVAVGVRGLTQGLSVERIAFLTVTRSGAAAMVAVTLCCLGWWIAQRTGRRPDPV